MASHDFNDRERLSLYPEQAMYVQLMMITIRDPPMPMGAWEPQGDPSSLGVLATLPVELLQELLERCDLRTMTRFSRVCVRARSAVQSLPAYRDLMRHAPHALAALSQTEHVKGFVGNAYEPTEHVESLPARPRAKRLHSRTDRCGDCRT